MEKGGAECRDLAVKNPEREGPGELEGLADPPEASRQGLHLVV